MNETRAMAAKLIGAILTGADLSEADMSLANLTDANLDGANLNNTDLSQATLTRNATGIVGVTTDLPDGWELTDAATLQSTNCSQNPQPLRAVC
jgi:uncharacterized protein YjbI with pentapeptide repeats